MRAAPGAGPGPGRFGWALGLAALLLLGLYLPLSSGGFGGTGDSYHYLAAAHSLRESGRLLGPDGQPYRLWAPLYPVLLALCYSPAAVRWLYGAALLGHLALWSWAGRSLLPGRRAWVLPLALALSTAVLVPAKFIWSETVFIFLAAAYGASLAAWLRTGRGRWLGWATLAGFLLPLQRTSGVFLLAGAGVGVLLGGAWHGRNRWRLAAHALGCLAGVCAWSLYAALVGTPESSLPGGWLKCLNSLADYGFVLLRWFVPLAANWRGAAPFIALGWACALTGVLAWLWPRSHSQERDASVATTTLRLFWWMALADVLSHVAAVTRSRAGAGPHDAERYLGALVGPVLLLALARWPAAGPERWRQALNGLVLAAWLGYSALRAGHNVAELRRRPPPPWPAAASKR